MERNKWLKITFVVAVLVFNGAFLLSSYMIIQNRIDRMNHQYSIDIHRDYRNETCLEIIDFAEEYDYGTLLNTTPRDSRRSFFITDPESRANYISQENIDHYSDYITHRKENYTKGQYHLEYSAESKMFNNIQLRLRSRRDPNEKRTGLYYGEEQLTFFPGVSSYLAYFNGTDLVTSGISDHYYSEETFEIEYNNCYVVRMRMEFSGKPKPDDGGGFIISQYAVFNQEGELSFLYNYRIDTGAATFL